MMKQLRGELPAQGRMLADAMIERVRERDDDWIEFTFSDVDSAAAPFERMRNQ
jgi:hypothetical protein